MSVALGGLYFVAPLEASLFGGVVRKNMEEQDGLDRRLSGLET
jgi:hypothetical protein